MSPSKELLEPQLSFPKEQWVEYAQALKAENARLASRAKQNEWAMRCKSKKRIKKMTREREAMKKLKKQFTKLVAGFLENTERMHIKTATVNQEEPPTSMEAYTMALKELNEILEV